MSATTQVYCLTLYVTYHQEVAIRELFTVKGWRFAKKGDESESSATQDESHLDTDLNGDSDNNDNDNGATSGTEGEGNIEDHVADGAQVMKEAVNLMKTMTENTDNIETDNPNNDDNDYAEVKTELDAVTDYDDGDDDDDLTSDLDYNDDESDDNNEEDSDEYLPDSETTKSGRKRKVTAPKTRSKKLKSEKKGKKGANVKTKLKTYGDKTATARRKAQKDSTSSSKSVKPAELNECTEKDEMINFDADLDVDSDRLNIELELQESDDIDHYETVLKSLSPDEPFNPPTDVQESDGFSESLGCYYCHDCGYTFQQQRWYDTHKWKGRCVYRCSVCSERFTFRNISLYRTHMTAHKLELEAGVISGLHFRLHTSAPVTKDLDKVLYRCSITDCEKVFPNKRNLHRHMKGHNKELYKCTRCSLFYPTREKLEEHNKSKHCRSLHKCKICDSGFITNVNLKRHVEACHSDTPPAFPCVECSKSFATLERLAEHSNFHLGAQPYACKFCQEPFYRQDSCQRHEKNCLTKKNKKKLEINMDLCDITNLKCKFAGCGKTFVKKFNLYRHTRGHNEQLFKCAKCTQYFETVEEYEEHMEQKHSQAFVCHHCGKTLTLKSNLTRHVKLCEAGHKVQCEWCPKKFSTREAMLMHANLHSGARPYSCKHCQKRFARYDSNIRHEKFCGGGGVLCRYCGRTFNSKFAILDHIAVEHENQRFTCGICGEPYKHRSSLNKHRKSKGH